MEKKMVLVLSMIMLIISGNSAGVTLGPGDCLDGCSTACVNSNTRLMARCERKCQIRLIEPQLHHSNQSPGGIPHERGQSNRQTRQREGPKCHKTRIGPSIPLLSIETPLSGQHQESTLLSAPTQSGELATTASPENPTLQSGELVTTAPAGEPTLLAPRRSRQWEPRLRQTAPHPPLHGEDAGRQATTETKSNTMWI
ncbi:Unknown protein [Striga hermonthica]|uniref:Uncharacterized protein n=1 Tax=Striga hermonthica TaxID=68872 RepID=A0A9N7NI18_STRHE|nr:Unknown protein [Striga hermonthica]